MTLRTAFRACTLLAGLIFIGLAVPAMAQQQCTSPCNNPSGLCPDVNIIDVSGFRDDGTFTVTVQYRMAGDMNWSWAGQGYYDVCGAVGSNAPCFGSEGYLTRKFELSAACWPPGTSAEFVVSARTCVTGWTMWIDLDRKTITVPGSSCGAGVTPCDPNDPTSDCYCPDEQDKSCEIQDKDCAKGRCQGSPCYVASGVYETSALDLQIPTNGFPLTLARVYNSSHGIDGALGRGWTSSLDARVFYAANRLGTPGTSPTVSWNQAIVVLPDGTHRAFTAPDPALPSGTPITFTAPAGRNDTLILNADTSWDLRVQHSLSVYHFGTDGRLETMTDDFGNRLRLTYDGSGRVQRIADESGSGRYLDVYWGPNGRISDVRDNASRVVHYDYDGNGMLVRAVDPANRNTDYLYTTGRFAPALAGIRDHWSRAITDLTWEQNSAAKPTGRLKSYTEEGETYTYSYENGQTVKTDSSNRTWTFPYRSDDLITQRQAPDGTSTTTYDGSGRLIESTDPAGARTQYAWTAAGILASVTQAAGTAEQVRYDYGYDANFPWKVTSIVPKNPATLATNRDWQETRYEYYAPGAVAPGALHKVHRVKTDGSSEVVTTYVYDSKGRVTRVLDALGNATDYTYDTAGNLATVTRPTNDDLGTRPPVTYGYDTVGRVTTITEGQAVTEITFDAVDRVTQTKVRKSSTCNAGEVCEFVTAVLYDQYEAGYQRLWVHQTDANGIVTKQAYDAFGRLVVSRDAGNNDTRYTYDKKHLVGVTDANDYTTAYEYDTAGRLWKTIFPDSAVESYTYFADGLLATKTDRKGNVIGYVYDGHKRLTDKIYNGGADGTIHFVYAGQKLVRVENRSQGVNEDHVYSYDSAYRTASEQQGPRGTVRWEYDVRDQVSRMSVDGGPTTDYTYYPDGSMNTITWSLVGGNFKYRYTPEGQYQTVTFPNGQSRNYSYDWAGRLLQLANLHPTAGNLANYSYGYDIDWSTGLKTKKGQRTSMTADVPAQGFAGALTKYLYDQNYQLTGADYPSAAPFNGEVARWAYDAIGNRTSETVNGVTANYTYQKIGTNPKNWQRLLGDGVRSFSYDLDGNMTSMGPASQPGVIQYDTDRNTLSINSGEVSFSNDFRARRTARLSPTATLHYLYSGISALSVSGHEFLLGGRLDEVFAEHTEGGIRYYSVDGLGSPVVLGDTSGGSQEAMAIDAWGKELAFGAGEQRILGFAAGIREPAQSTVVFRRRTMDPRVGRFLQEDPLFSRPRIAGSYSYVENDPISWTDPLGLEHVQEPGFTKPMTPENIGPMWPDLWRAGFKCFTICSTVGFADDIAVGGSSLTITPIRKWVKKHIEIITKCGEKVAVAGLIYCEYYCFWSGPNHTPRDTFPIPFVSGKK